MAENDRKLPTLGYCHRNQLTLQTAVARDACIGQISTIMRTLLGSVPENRAISSFARVITSARVGAASVVDSPLIG